VAADAAVREGAEVESVPLWATAVRLDTSDGCVVVVELGFEVAVGRVEVEVFGVGLAADGLSAVEPASGVDDC
jgi:hypothetical protein